MYHLKRFLKKNKVHRDVSSFGSAWEIAAPTREPQHATSQLPTQSSEKAPVQYREGKVSIDTMKAEVDAVKDIMLQNVHKVTLREEKLETLMNRADDLENSAKMFNQSAGKLQRKYWWKDVKMVFFMALMCLFVVYLFVSMVCGGFLWDSCIG